MVLMLSLTVVVGSAGVAVAQESPSDSTNTDGEETDTSDSDSEDSSSSSDGDSSSEPESTAKKIELNVSQQSYIESSVKSAEKQGRMVYEVQGPQVTLATPNLDRSNVVDYGVKGDTGSLIWNEKDQVYRLDFNSTDGSYTVYWVVEKEVETSSSDGTQDGENQTTTTTVTERYEAVVVASNTSYAHIPQSELESTREKADKWESFKNRASEYIPSRAAQNMEDVVDLSIATLAFAAEPLSALTGGYTATWIQLILTPGGNLVGVTIIAVIVVFAGGAIKYGNVRAARDQYRKKLDDVKAEIDREKRNRASIMKSLHEVYHHGNIAEIAIEAFGAKNLGDAYDSYRDIVNEGEVLADRIQTMVSDGYDVVRRNGDIQMTDDPQDSDDVLAVKDLDEDDLEQLAYDEEVEQYRMQDADVDIESVKFNADIKEVAERLEYDVLDAKDRDQFNEMLVELLAQKRKHDSTDSEGRIRPIRELVEVLMRIPKEADRYGYPAAEYELQHWMALLDTESTSEDAQELLNRVEQSDINGGDRE